MKILTKLILTTALVSGISACNPTLMNQTEDCCTPTEWDESSAPEVNDSLTESAERAAGAAEVLAQIEAAKTAPQEAPVAEEEMSQLPAELLRPTTVEWMGPALDLTHELARNIGYEFAVMGQLPPVDVMVSVSAVDEPAVKVFENIGYQVAEFATVYLDPNTKRVEFRFKSNEMAATTTPEVVAAPVAKPSQPKVVRRDRLGK